MNVLKNLAAKINQPNGAPWVMNQPAAGGGMSGTSGGVVPIGGIIMWSGAVVDIDPHWALCDGGGTTPDLTDRFIVGAGGTYAVGATGGYKWHGETENNHGNHRLAHHHPIGTTSQDLATTGATANWRIIDVTGNVVWDAGTTGAHRPPDVYDESIHNGAANSNADTDNRPPFYALAFIQRIS